MKRNTSSFDKALSAANKRLEQAVAERTEAQERLSALNTEIPALQRTIAALEHQLNPGIERTTGVPLRDMAAMGERIAADVPHGVVVPPEDLSQMGSIPAGSGPPAKELTEDELLQEPEGVPLTED